MNVVQGNNFLGPEPFSRVFQNAHLVRERGNNRRQMSRQLLYLPELCMKNRDRVIKPVALSLPAWPRNLIKAYAAHSAQMFNSLSTEYLFKWRMILAVMLSSQFISFHIRSSHMIYFICIIQNTYSYHPCQYCTPDVWANSLPVISCPWCFAKDVSVRFFSDQEQLVTVMATTKPILVHMLILGFTRRC